MIVAVFGSASPKRGDALYELSVELGQALAAKSHTVMTGGYCGTMEGACEGALRVEAAHTMGVTCDEIESYRPGVANAYVREEVRTKSLNERIDFLTRHADAFIALPGGVGTLAEIMMAYNLMVIDAIARKPFILMGEEWRSTFERFFEKQDAHIPAFSKTLPTFVESVEEAVKALENTI